MWLQRGLDVTGGNSCCCTIKHRALFCKRGYPTCLMKVSGVYQWWQEFINQLPKTQQRRCCSPALLCFCWDFCKRFLVFFSSEPRLWGTVAQQGAKEYGSQLMLPSPAQTTSPSRQWGSSPTPVVECFAFGSPKPGWVQVMQAPASPNQVITARCAFGSSARGSWTRHRCQGANGLV